MLEDAGPWRDVAERSVRADRTVETDFDEFARFDLPFELRAHHVERHGLAGEDLGIAQPAHHQRADAQRIAAGDHAVGGRHDQRIGTLDQPQGVDQLVEYGLESAGGDKMDDDLGIRGRLEDGPTLHQVAPEVDRIRDIAVVRHRETAAGQVGIKRLDVAQAGAPGGRITHMAHGHRAGQFGDRFAAGEIIRHMPQAAAREELRPVEAGDADRFLSAMLQGMKAQRAGGGGFRCADYAENAALFMQLVAVRVEQGVGEVHHLQIACRALQWGGSPKITSLSPDAERYRGGYTFRTFSIVAHSHPSIPSCLHDCSFNSDMLFDPDILVCARREWSAAREKRTLALAECASV